MKPLVDKYSGRYWKIEITKAKERSKSFIDMAEESIRVYNAHKQINVLTDTERRLNSWWYCVNTLMPAYYSSTPKAEVGLRKRTGGIIEELSATILERNVQYQMDVNFPFDTIGSNATLQFLLTGRAVLWPRYEVELDDEMVEIAIFKAPDGTYVDDKGAPFDITDKELRQGPGNITLVKITIEAKKEEYACLDVVQYSDYFCSDARNETEVEWRAKRAYLTRETAEKLFGNRADKLKYDSFPDKNSRDRQRDNTNIEGKAEIYEIWCEDAERVFWYSDSFEEGIILESEPPFEFEDFYPCTIIAQSTDPDSVLPVSDYAHVKDQILEVERLTTRIHAVTQAIRTNALYDSSLGNQVEQMLIGDLKMVPVINWPSYKGRGGLANGVEFMDVTPYINALQVLQAARQTALQQLYETLKVSDLLRGTSEQYKSATANRLENAWSSMGLIVRQNMFTKFMSDGIEKLGTIIASQFEPEDIFEIGDADRLISAVLPPPPPPPVGPDGQPIPVPLPDPQIQIDQVKQQIIGLYRNDDRLSYRIRIASDSMVAVDQAQEQQESAQLMSTTGEFFNQMRSLIEQYPPLLGFSIELFQNVIKRFKGGKELDGIFTKALAQIGEIAAAKEEAAKQPPPPDPVMQEVQGRLQIAQLESQARIEATRLQMADAHEKNMLAFQEQQIKAQREQLMSQLEIQKQQFNEYIKQQEVAISQQEAQVKANSVQVDMLKVQAMTESEASKQAITQESNRMSQILEIQKLELEQMRMRLVESEKLMEERRLESEQQLEKIRIAMDSIKVGSQEATKSQPIVINNVIPKRAKRVGKVTMDELGNPSIELNDMDEEA
jgi:hypothetical protein